MTVNSEKLILMNARVVLPDNVVDSATVTIENSIIARIGDDAHASPDNNIREIDLHGLTLFPGFIDVHIHGAAGVDTMDASPDELRCVADFLGRNGVTGWLPTLVPATEEKYTKSVSAIGELVRDSQDEKSSAYARPLGVHYEGPFVNSEQCGALHREHFRVFTSRETVDDLPKVQHPQAIHMMTLAPEVEGGINLIKELKKRGWIVSIGHTRAKRDVLDEARAAGATHMTHFMNAMTPLHHRDLGAVGWGLIHDDVTIDMIADGIHLDREIVRLIVKRKGSERVSLISDAIAAAGMGDGDYEIWGEKISVTNGRTSNSKGSIAGSVITMLDAVRMMLSLGFAESDVARMASLNPARLLGIDRDCGAIEEGKRADLVALDKDLNVRLTVIGGAIAHDRITHD